MENPNVQAKMKKTKEIVLRAIEDLRPYLLVLLFNFSYLDNTAKDSKFIKTTIIKI